MSQAEAFSNTELDRLEELLKANVGSLNARLDSLAAPPPPPSPGAANVGASGERERIAEDIRAFSALMMRLIDALRTRLTNVEERLDALEQRTRRKVLLIHGVAEKPGENLQESVLGILAKLKVPELNAGSISACYRFGRTTSNLKRPIFLRFRSMEIRTSVWNSKTELRGSGVTMSEFLTAPRQAVFTKARKLFGVTKCWTREGQVFVAGPDRNSRLRVNSLARLSEIATEYPKLVVVPRSSTGEGSRSGSSNDVPSASRQTRAKSKIDKAKNP